MEKSNLFFTLILSKHSHTKHFADTSNIIQDNKYVLPNNTSIRGRLLQDKNDDFLFLSSSTYPKINYAPP
jgi:hypothetical protein